MKELVTSLRPACGWLATASLLAVVLRFGLGATVHSGVEHDRAVQRGAVNADFSGTQARMRVGRHAVAIDFASLGRAGRVAALPPGGAFVVRGDERTRERGPAIEWWRIEDAGFEHGLTLTERPEGTGALVVRLRVDGDAIPVVREDDVSLVVPGVGSVARYGALAVVDANGTRVPARFAHDERGLSIEVDDAAAAYPLVIDPLFTAAAQILEPPVRNTGDAIGVAAAISDDGTVAVLGASATDGTSPTTVDSGVAYVYVRTGTTWTLVQTLQAASRAASDFCGVTAAVDATGQRIVLGCSGREIGVANNAGALLVFDRSGPATWSQATTVTAATPTSSGFLGGAMTRISAAGDRIVSSGVTTGGMDAVFVFRRDPAGWVQEQVVVGAGVETTDYFGYCVDISDDASYMVVGAPYDSEASGTATTRNGAVYTFSRTGTTWTEVAKLFAPTRVTEGRIGIACALDATATRMAVATEPTNLDGNGTVHLYSRAALTFSHLEDLPAPTVCVPRRFAMALAMSNDGTRLAVSAANCPESSPYYDAGAVLVYDRGATTWTDVARLEAPFPESYEYLARIDGTLAMDGAGRLTLAGARGQDGSGTFDVSIGRGYVFSSGDAGSPCTGAGDCDLGFCVDGVCCDSACGGGLTNDCVACAEALTGVPDGTCAPHSAAVAPTIVCRAEASACDAAEVCSSTSAACPADVAAPSSRVCRASGGPCDIVEACDGTGFACPADAFASSGVCRAAAGVCDATESCDGTSAACPDDARLAANTVCRASVGICDLAEACDGTSTACPADTLVTGVVCRAPAGPCDLAESCTGAGPNCPADAFAPIATVCALAAGVCDAHDLCDGSGTCVPTFAVDGQSCDDGANCTQASACQLGVCTPTLMLDCSDQDPCTTDACQEPGTCTHVPIVACGTTDAGVDSGTNAGTDSGVDASLVDSGTAVADSGACSCRVAGSRSDGGWGYAWVLAASLLYAARRTRASRD